MRQILEPVGRASSRRWPNDSEIEAVVEVPDGLTHSHVTVRLSGFPPHGKLLIPLERRDVRVVEGARLESVCRGNSTVGSNPTLSASLRQPARFARWLRLASQRGSLHLQTKECAEGSRIAAAVNVQVCGNSGQLRDRTARRLTADPSGGREVFTAVDTTLGPRQRAT